MKLKRLFLTVAIAIVILLSGCAKDNFQETVGLCPLVTATNPINSATGVLRNIVVTATFNEEMNSSTITATSFTVEGSSPVKGAITYSGNTVSFTPASNLDADTTFICKLSTSIKDLNGNALQADYVWTFSTGPILMPVVTTTDPQNHAIGIALNKTVSASFNMIMDPLTVNATTFTLKQGTTKITGTVTYSGTKAVFTPSVLLSANTFYTATITNGVKNSLDTPLANNYVWTFTTGNLLAPKVILTDPLNIATGVSLNKIVTTTFNTTMNPLTVNKNTFTIKQGSTAIEGDVSYTGTVATFIPKNAFTANTIYTATITTGTKNLIGTALANNYVWTFTTGNLFEPKVILTDPLDFATGVSLNKIVTATFNTTMDPTTVNTNTFKIKQGSTAISGVVSYIGSVATFIPTNVFTANTIYTATITTDTKNLIGTAITNNYVWTFSTLTIPNLPNLGSASIFGAFGGNAGVTNQGINTVINNGSIATTAASTLVTGFHDSKAIYTETPLNVANVTGAVYTAPPTPGTATSFGIASQGLIDANTTYNSISPASMPSGMDPGAGELGGLTLAPGVYKSASGTFKITNGDLTLDAKGDPNALWIFQTAAGLTVGIAGPTGAKSVIMKNGALPKNVFWYVGSAATINGAGGGIMVGTIIAKSGVTFSTAGNTVQTVLNGRAISLIASVTMVNTTINVPNQ